MEFNNLATGLGILTMALFPLLLPGVLLITLPFLPLLPVVALLIAILAVPVWIGRAVRRRSRRRPAARRVAVSSPG